MGNIKQKQVNPKGAGWWIWLPGRYGEKCIWATWESILGRLVQRWCFTVLILSYRPMT